MVSGANTESRPGGIGGPFAVTVCICTFRRPSVVAAIESVAAQVLPAEVVLQILIVDNDSVPSAQALVEAVAARSPIEIVYRHAPGQNISIARNAALDSVTTPWLAFIDDDEYAAPQWLADLIAASPGHNAVFGPSIATYGAAAPGWIKAGDYHSNYILGERLPIVTGHTSNALIDMNFVRAFGLRFDPDLGRTGGEDTMFFYAMFRNKGVLAYVENSIVREDVAPSRANLKWVARRKFRAGQVYGKMFDRFDKTSYRRMRLTAPLKVITCAFMAIATIFAPYRAMAWLMRGTFHLGTISYVLGFGVVKEYGAPAA